MYQFIKSYYFTIMSSIWNFMTSIVSGVYGGSSSASADPNFFGNCPYCRQGVYQGQRRRCEDRKLYHAVCWQKAQLE